MTDTLPVSTSQRIELKDITGQVRRAIGRMGLTDGHLLIYVPHTTAGVTINEAADPMVARDIEDTLNRLVPADAGYRHAEGNADAHVKATLVGSSVLVRVESGRPVLGTWQGIFFCEFDGPRHRRVELSVVGG
ncbi:MAG: secondary thiamine-phosphate synthase enzyme YjbQ [Proteobacteria bacterium]|nr:secondary thiamine-phosphate synthase enzyme YjbQ [Pseudomonadota bacterium]